MLKVPWFVSPIHGKKNPSSQARPKSPRGRPRGNDKSPRGKDKALLCDHRLHMHWGDVDGLKPW